MTFPRLGGQPSVWPSLATQTDAEDGTGHVAHRGMGGRRRIWPP